MANELDLDRIESVDLPSNMSHDSITVYRADYSALIQKAREAEGLREALEPFAEAAGKLDGLWSNDDWRWNDGTLKCVTVGDLRRARQALENPTKGTT